MRCKNCRCRREIPDGALYCQFCGWCQMRQPIKHKRRMPGTGTVYKNTGNRSKPYCPAKNGLYLGSFATLAEAEEARCKLPQETGSHYNDTLGMVRESWMQERYRSLSPASQQQYDIAWEKLKPLENRKLRELRAPDYHGQYLIGGEKTGRP